MRRQGRQHGVVRTHWSPTRTIGTRVTAKPNNHSKFTGKCDRARCSICHSHPVSKSIHKSKGSHKLRSLDVSFNHRLASWRLVDHGGWPCGSGNSFLHGSSAARILDQLANPPPWGEYEDYDDDYESEAADEVSDYASRYHPCSCSFRLRRIGESGAVSDGIRIADDDDGGEGDLGVEMEGGTEGIVVGLNDGDEEDDYLGFEDVGIVWDSVDGEEGWTLVGGARFVVA